MKVVLFISLSLTFLFFSPTLVLANKSIDFGSCSLTPQESSSTNPKVSGDTFLTSCSGSTEGSNIYNYSFVDSYTEVINLISITFNLNTSSSYWVLNTTSNLYVQNSFDLLKTYNMGESFDLKILFAPGSTLANPTSNLTITFNNCTDNQSKATCHEVGRETLDLVAQTTLRVPTLSISESSLDFGDLSINSNLERSFNVTNDSSIELVAKVIKKEGSKDGFTVSNDLLSKLDTSETYTISAGFPTSYSVNFSPLSEKDYKLQVEFKPKDSMMAKYVEGKNITFKGKGIKPIIPLSLTLETLSQNKVDDKEDFIWKLSGTGEVKDLPWTVEIPTTCENKGLENDGSFKWKVLEFSQEKPFEFKNSLETKWVESESPVTVLVKDKNDTVVLSQELQFKSCYLELPTLDTTKDLDDLSPEPLQTPTSPSNLDPRSQMSQNSQSPNEQSSSSSFKLDSPKLTDLGNPELNFSKDVKGTSDTNLTKGFWIRLISYIVIVGGIVLAVWYSKKEMLKNVVIISEENITSIKEKEEPGKSIKLE